MELLKAILNLITSFFQNKTAKSKEEVSLAEKTEQAVVEEIRATENAVAVEQLKKAQEAVKNVREEQKEKLQQEKKKPLDEQLDNQFGSDD